MIGDTPQPAIVGDVPSWRQPFDQYRVYACWFGEDSATRGQTMPTHELHVRLHPAFDRFNEAHWYLHQIEDNYHFSDPVRWNINAFLRSLKEIPQLISMAVQNDHALLEWYQLRRKELVADPIIGQLSVARDYLVHQGTLFPNSSAAVGITEGRGMKFGMSFPLNCQEDSDAGMMRYIQVAKAKSGDFLRVLAPDEESTPCVRRIWRLVDVAPDEEVLDLLSRAWGLVGAVLSELNERDQPDQPLQLALSCRHSVQRVQFRLYDRAELAREFRRIEPADAPRRNDRGDGA